MLNITKKQRQEIKKWQDEYIKAKAEYLAIKSISEENELKILSENIFTDEEGQRVFKYPYRIAENQFEKFLELLFQENIKSELPVYEVNRVPEADAKKKMDIAEKELFKLQLETLPNYLKKDIEEAQKHWKLRDRALELILKMAV